MPLAKPPAPTSATRTAPGAPASGLGLATTRAARRLADRVGIRRAAPAAAGSSRLQRVVCGAGAARPGRSP